MLNKETKKRIDDARDILVGQLPLPTDQIELITLALIYKFMDDQDELLREIGLPEKFFTGELATYGWQKLMSREINADTRLVLFADAIRAFERAKHLPQLFRQIFNNSLLRFRDAKVLSRFLDKINEFQYSHSEELGNAFEYLLMTMGAQGDNGQFRTPRNVIDFIVDVVSPDVTDTILDPACGTGGFLVSAYKHILARYTTGFEDYLPTLGNRTDEQLAVARWGDKLTAPQKQKLGAHIQGYDITPLMTRLARVNLYLHHFPSPNIHDYDTIGTNTRWGDKFDVILANPPFMTPKGGVEAHEKFRLKISKKAEVLFSDYILEHLTPNGRAGFIVPEGIVFTNSGDYVTLRKWAIEEGGLWAVVSLPANVFQPYSGVKTTILFIDRAQARARDEILLLKVENDGYSLNANRNPIAKNDLPLALEMLTSFRDLPEDFEDAYGNGDNPPAGALKYRVVPRADFARLDAYKAASTAKDYLIKTYAALRKQVDAWRAPNGRKTGSAEEFQRALADKITTFHRATGWKPADGQKGLATAEPDLLLPKDEAELLKWFNREVKEAAVRYSVELDEKAKLGEGVKEVLDRRREYNLSLDRFSFAIGISKSQFDLVSLGEVCNLIRGVTFNKKDQKDEETPETIRIATTKAAQEKGLVEKDLYYIPKTLIQDEKLILKPGDILISTANSLALLGRTTYIEQINYRASFGAFMTVVRPKPQVLHGFLLHCLRSDEAQRFIQSRAKTTTNISNLGFDDLYEFQIPLPPLSIQQQIVDEINGYQKVIDGCRGVIENYKPVVEVEEEWERVTLSEICEIDPKRPKMGEGKEVSFLPMADMGIRDFHVNPKQVKNLNETKGYTYFEEGDVLLAKITPCFENGKIGLVRKLKNGMGFGSTEYYVFRTKDKILPEFLFFSLLSPQFMQEGERSMTGAAGQQRVTKNFITNFEIHLPDLPTQRRIVTELEADLAVVEGVKRLHKKMEDQVRAAIGRVWGKPE